MKCSACENKKCGRKYENRHECVGEKEGIECSCSCQVSLVEEITASAASLGSGIVAAGAGVALTIMTGGWFGVIAGASMIGAGSTLVMNPFQRKITGERMTARDTVQDVALGATIGR
jgi:hypothetical protein